MTPDQIKEASKLVRERENLLRAFSNVTKGKTESYELYAGQGTYLLLTAAQVKHLIHERLEAISGALKLLGVTI